VKKVADIGGDMKIFLKLVLHHLRLALLLRYAPELSKEISLEISDVDMEFLKTLVKDKSGMISSKTLASLLEAYQKTNHAFIPSLPLELALVELLDKKQ
jgi:hypothetical protein